MRWLQEQELEVLVDPSEDNELGEEGQVLGPVFMPDVARFDPGQLATQTDFIICLGGDGEGRWVPELSGGWRCSACSPVVVWWLDVCGCVWGGMAHFSF